MLVIEPQEIPVGSAGAVREPPGVQTRIDCLGLAKKLRVIVWKGQQNEDYFSKPASGPPHDPIFKKSQMVNIPKSATELVKKQSMVSSPTTELESSTAASVSTDIKRLKTASVSTTVTNPTLSTSPPSVDVDIKSDLSTGERDQRKTPTHGTKTRLKEQQALPLRCSYLDTDVLLERLKDVYKDDRNFKLVVC